MVHKYGSTDKALLAHSYFNMAIMNFLGNGTEKNITRFNHFMDLSQKNEETLAVPVYLIKNLAKLEDLTLTTLIDNSLTFFDIYLKDVILSGVSLIIALYSLFFINLKKQQS